MSRPAALTESWLTGRTVLITGAASGIGLTAAQSLARLGAKLILVSRDEARGQAALAAVRTETPHAAVEFYAADLASQADVRRLADRVLSSQPTLDCLINNVGAVFAERVLTADGVERTFATNYLNQVLLTRLLIDRLAASSRDGIPSRIVMVCSFGHRRGRTERISVTGPPRYLSVLAYRDSKLAQAFFTRELARRLANWPVRVNAVCPGFTKTTIGSKHTGGLVGWMWNTSANLFARPLEVGTSTVIHAAASNELHNVSGEFFERCQLTSFGRQTDDLAAAQRLWNEASERLGLPVDLPPR